MQDPYLVFISHSARDTWVARKIAADIESLGASIFLDEANVDVGEDFEEVIRNSLNRSQELIVLITPWALERPYVWMEIGVAWGRGIPIVALLLGLTPGELQARPGTPVALKRRDLLELNEMDTYLGQLEVRVHSRRDRS